MAYTITRKKILSKIYFKTRFITQNKVEHSIMIKREVYQEDILILKPQYAYSKNYQNQREK